MANFKQKIKEKMARKYRLEFLNVRSGHLVFGVTSAFNRIIVTVVTALVVTMAGVYALIAFTPLRETIPGYPSAEFRSKALQNAAKLDSLEEVTALWSIQLTNIQRIVSGRTPYDIDSLYTVFEGDVSDISQALKDSIARDDSLLRAEVSSQEMYTVSSGNRVTQLEGILFFPPVKGVVTEPYNPSIRHPFVDVAVPENTTVNSALDGTVISSVWSDETGYTMIIQHGNDIITIYRHNVRLLKRAGDKVKAGTAIAIAGDAGKLSTGSHLHFELWYKGEPINPETFIKF